jgi:hypothetical protein
VVDVASQRGFLGPSTARWLLRELGEVADDPEETIHRAREALALAAGTEQDTVIR